MSRKHYIRAFMLLAILFVPIFVFLFFAGISAPISYYLIETALGRSRAGPMVLFIFEVAELLLYTGLFYMLASWTFRLSQFPQQTSYRIGLQSLFLLALFCCSFLPVLGEGDIRGATGTYNFWSAVYHYIKIYPAYGSGRAY